MRAAKVQASLRIRRGPIDYHIFGLTVQALKAIFVTYAPLSRTSPCHLRPPVTYAPCHVRPPVTYVPLSRTPSCHVRPPVTYVPCHVRPPVTHALLSRTPPCHVRPPLCVLPLKDICGIPNSEVSIEYNENILISILFY